MTRIEMIKEGIDKLAAARIKLSEATDGVNKAAKEYRLISATVFDLISEQEPPKHNATPGNEHAYELISKYLVADFRIKTTVEIRNHLDRKSKDLRELNTYQVGILLSKCGFRSGVKGNKRGYYVKFKEL